MEEWNSIIIIKTLTTMDTVIWWGIARILLAIAMSTKPTLLLLDEVSSALDLQPRLAVEKSIVFVMRSR